MEFITCNISLQVGKFYPATDRYTGDEANFAVIREATKEEYLAQPDIEHNPLEFYYLIHFD